MSDSSSSSSTSSSTDGLSFILEESSDDSPILETVMLNEDAPKIVEVGPKVETY